MDCVLDDMKRFHTSMLRCEKRVNVGGHPMMYIKVKGKEQSVEDRPSRFYADGSRCWTHRSERCRFGGPAERYADGGCTWWAPTTDVPEQRLSKSGKQRLPYTSALAGGWWKIGAGGKVEYIVSWVNEQPTAYEALKYLLKIQMPLNIYHADEYYINHSFYRDGRCYRWGGNSIHE